jgi:hypothetical protein
VVVSGAALVFTATPAAGLPILNYAWTLDGVPVASGASMSTYTHSAVTSQGGKIMSVVCTVTTAGGIGSSNVALMTVQVRSRSETLTPNWFAHVHYCSTFLSCFHQHSLRMIRLRSQCPTGQYASFGVGCQPCPSFTSSSSPGAHRCLPTCPLTNTLTLT